MELAFLRFEVKVGLLEGLQHGSYMRAVFHQGIGVDEDVIDVSVAEDVKVLAENVIDEMLEGCVGIGEAEWNNQVFVVAKAGAEDCLPFFPIGHANKVVGASEVQLGNHLALNSFIEVS